MNELRKLQLTQLELLREVDSICRKNNLRYFLSTGTLIGAVRHKGFIPWDDDVDVSMPYDDYIKFCKICETELDNKIFFLQTKDTDKYYEYIFAKLRLQNTLYIRKGQEHMKYHHGICIDIFPWYPVPTNAILESIFIKIVKWCKTILWSPIGAISEKRIFYKFLYRLLSFVPAKIPHGIIHKMCSWCSGDLLIDIGEPFYGNKKINKKRHSFINETRLQVKKHLQVTKIIEMEFEGYNYFAPSNYHYYLTFMYGDYMTLPPIESRQGNHLASTIKYKEPNN